MWIATGYEDNGGSAEVSFDKQMVRWTYNGRLFQWDREVNRGMVNNELVWFCDHHTYDAEFADVLEKLYMKYITQEVLLTHGDRYESSI